MFNNDYACRQLQAANLLLQHYMRTVNAGAVGRLAAFARTHVWHPAGFSRPLASLYTSHRQTMLGRFSIQHNWWQVCSVPYLSCLFLQPRASWRNDSYSCRVPMSSACSSCRKHAVAVASRLLIHWLLNPFYFVSRVARMATVRTLLRRTKRKNKIIVFRISFFLGQNSYCLIVCS